MRVVDMVPTRADLGREGATIVYHNLIVCSRLGRMAGI
jgi:hypothetical protein